MSGRSGAPTLTRSPTHLLMAYLAIFAVAFIASAALTPLARRLSLRWGVVAEPGGRRKHHGRTPKLGGLPLMGALLITTPVINRLLPTPPGTDERQLLTGVFWGTLVVFVGGLLDDWFELPAWLQFVIYIAGAGIAIWYKVFIERFTSPLPSDVLWEWGPMRFLFDYKDPLVIVQPFLIWLFTLFWIVGMINTVNFLDGLDGLATGVGTIAALMFAGHSYQIAQEITQQTGLHTSQYTVAAFPLALAGALLGFLPFNFAPARIFLGSAGAYLLGYQLATLAIISPAKIATALLVMAVPILDVAWQIIDRLRRRQSPLHGDRGHLHFRLSDGGLPTRWIVLGYYVVALAFGLVAIFASTPLVKLVILAVLGTAVLALLIWLSSRSDAV
ncbi:MAG: undecaprenyl/decaprenyl-phosphate alpha-N-acetylglucosaminyl 1-phosphate transferase [Chloroflexi bacterium]|nr:undecaprenyl/decaprenyl-phosphate alpha-N-acetylglucosaminyl 1-phosphate transferase [Chloroflexota bacterium]